MKNYRTFLTEVKLASLIGGLISTAVKSVVQNHLAKKEAAHKAIQRIEKTKVKQLSKALVSANKKNLSAHEKAYGEHKWDDNAEYDADPVAYGMAKPRPEDFEPAPKRKAPYKHPGLDYEKPVGYKDA